MKPSSACQSSTSGAFRPAARSSAATFTNGRQSSFSGGASITMRVPASVSTRR
jgi:hypothetical protein